MVASTIATSVGSGVNTASSGGEIAYLMLARSSAMRQPSRSSTGGSLYAKVPSPRHTRPRRTSPRRVRRRLGLRIMGSGHRLSGVTSGGRRFPWSAARSFSSVAYRRIILGCRVRLGHLSRCPAVAPVPCHGGPVKHPDVTDRRRIESTMHPAAASRCGRPTSPSCSRIQEGSRLRYFGRLSVAPGEPTGASLLYLS